MNAETEPSQVRQTLRDGIKWLEQPQARNPFETIHISRHEFRIILQRRSNQDGIGKAHFSFLAAAIALLAACHQWERLRD
jgi:hypothetical protein